MPPRPPDPETDTLAQSQRALRAGLGVIGLLLPFVLILGDAIVDLRPYRSSISAHYYAPNFGAVFTGSLCAIGVFLVYYRGYPNRVADHADWPMRTAPGRMAERMLTDARVTTVAGLAAIGTALVPTTLDTGQPPFVRASEGAHLALAATFFVAVTYMALFQFTRSDTPPAAQSPAKRWRNRFFRACGIAMAAALAGIAAGTLAGGFAPGSRAVFWLEAIAVWAFASSWLVKGLPEPAAEPPR